MLDTSLLLKVPIKVFTDEENDADELSNGEWQLLKDNKDLY